DLAAHAGEEVAATAVVAVAAMAAVPPDADGLARLPAGGAGADLVDDAGDLVAWDPGVLETRKPALLDERIAVADAAGADLDPHGAGAGLGDRPLDDLEGAFRAGNLRDAHRRHDSSNFGRTRRRARAWLIIGDRSGEATPPRVTSSAWRRGSVSCRR